MSERWSRSCWTPSKLWPMREEASRTPVQARTGPGPQAYRPFHLWQARTSACFGTGGIFSQMAFWLQILSLGWLVWELTKDPDTGQGSALLSGTVSGLRALPTLVLSPWAGVLLDRIDRRKVVNCRPVSSGRIGCPVRLHGGIRLSGGLARFRLLRRNRGLLRAGYAGPSSPHRQHGPAPQHGERLRP